MLAYHQTFTWLAQLFVERRGGVFDLDIVQWSVFVDNARSPPSLLGNRGSGSFQCLRDLIGIIECLVNLIQQL